MARKPQKQPTPEQIKEFAEWLGRIIIAASQVEHILGLTIADLLKVNRLQHSSLIIPTSIGNRVQLLTQLGQSYLTKTEQKSLKNHLKEIEDCASLRNSLAHGFYGAKNGRPAVIWHRGNGRFSGQPFEWTSDHFRKLLLRLHRLQTSTIYEIRHLFPSRLKQPKNRKAIAPIV